MTEIVSIASDVLSVRIASLGAELQSLRDAAGRDYLTNGDPAWWTGRAPVLFPIVGGLNGGVYRLDGREYALPRHGFARRREFALVEHRPNLARFRLADDAETRAVYPFAFELELAYRLSGNRLETEALVRNTGEAELPFGLGFHPGFAWPLPDGGEKLAHAIVFDRDEPAPIRLLDDAGMLSGNDEGPVQGNRIDLAPELFVRDALVWDRLESAGLDYVGQDGRAGLRIDFPDTIHLGIWQKPGADFVCLEPWQGHADEAGFTGDLRDKPGIVQLAPGRVRSFRMDVTVHPAGG